MADPDILIFYSPEDEPIAGQLVHVLGELGWSVWWDKKLPAREWDVTVYSLIDRCKCAIPIWGKHSLQPGKRVINEAIAAKEASKPVFPVMVGGLKKPIDFNRHPTFDFDGWNGEKEHKGFSQLVNALAAQLGGIPSAVKSPKRLEELRCNGAVIKLPCFVRSVSSFETQFASPYNALKALELYPSNEAILVSAYDTFLPSDANTKQKDENVRIIAILSALAKKGCPIFLDSGNYEAARNKELASQAVAGKQKELWTLDKYESALKATPFSLAFCYDEIVPSDKEEVNIQNVIESVKRHTDGRIVPIVHAPREEDGNRISDRLPALVATVSAKLRPPIIAVPERELGEGIFNRANQLFEIRKALNSLGYYQVVHVLGTGNPISIAILAAAGGDLFDGLEWCRTSTDRPSMTLHHHQHFDFHRIQSVEEGSCEFIREAMSDEGASHTLKMALHNLDSYQGFIDELRFYLHKGKIGEFLALYLKKNLLEQLKAACGEFLQ